MPVAFNAPFNNGPLNKLYNIDWEKRATEVMWLADAGQVTAAIGPTVGDSFSALDNLNAGMYAFYRASDRTTRWRSKRVPTLTPRVTPRPTFAGGTGPAVRRAAATRAG